ncbi:hypothetical protein QBC42DRAFT_10204 [Cladorrhinum samala]|uniref:Uncharacterized protein n=1 Tax=Cladorrhinum samala TaxID=585594 RepID=A0AAV9HEQ9_9PEZI|nr:hypothetical protein QBC42DRAFT_10204 [Cladorrhinum samala]
MSFRPWIVCVGALQEIWGLKKANMSYRWRCEMPVNSTEQRPMRPAILEVKVLSTKLHMSAVQGPWYLVLSHSRGLGLSPQLSGWCWPPLPKNHGQKISPRCTFFCYEAGRNMAPAPSFNQPPIVKYGRRRPPPLSQNLPPLLPYKPRATHTQTCTLNTNRHHRHLFLFQRRGPLLRASLLPSLLHILNSPPPTLHIQPFAGHYAKTHTSGRPSAATTIVIAGKVHAILTRTPQLYPKILIKTPNSQVCAQLRFLRAQLQRTRCAQRVLPPQLPLNSIDRLAIFTISSYPSTAKPRLGFFYFLFFFFPSRSRLVYLDRVSF